MLDYSTVSVHSNEDSKSAKVVKMATLKNKTILFGSLWIFLIVIFLMYLSVATQFFQTTIDQGPLQGTFWNNLVIGTLLLGGFSFIGFVTNLTLLAMDSGKTADATPSILRTAFDSVLFFIYLAILPVYLLIKVWSPSKFVSFIKSIKNNLSKSTLLIILKKLVASLAIVSILVPIWIAGYFTVGFLVSEQLGLTTQGILISGTGSMYPTFPKGEGEDPIELSNQVVSTQGMFPYPNGLVVFGKRYFGHQIERGDIVIVEDDKTREITEEVYGSPSGWVKRVIALAGDTLEIRDGIVYLNGEAQKEPYIARARSTFGQSFLDECKPVTVPDNSIFVMGDNRTGSGDSREVGFFSIDAVNHALPLMNQEGELMQNWHDVSNDLDESAKIILNKELYLDTLNQRRTEEGLKPLRYNDKLELSAQKRGEVIIEYDDFSFEATRSAYTMENAMQDVGYYNTFWGEAPSYGYFEADELLDYQLEFPDSKDFIYDARFQEVGIAEVTGEINGCPTHVIVQHFGGYVPPNYSAENIQSWKDGLASIKNIQSSWLELKNSGQFYDQHRQKIDRLNQIIDLRINKLTDIVGTMNANKWFSAEQRNYAENGDWVLAKEQDELATFLNSQ